MVMITKVLHYITNFLYNVWEGVNKIILKLSHVLCLMMTREIRYILFPLDGKQYNYLLKFVLWMKLELENISHLLNLIWYNCIRQHCLLLTPVYFYQGNINGNLLFCHMTVYNIPEYISRKYKSLAKRKIWQKTDFQSCVSCLSQLDLSDLIVNFHFWWKEPFFLVV